MIIEAIILGIIIGYIRKGRVSRIGYLKLNFSFLLALSLLSYAAIIIMNLGLLDISSAMYSIFFVLSYVMIIIFLVFNLDKKFMFMPLIGASMNFLGICLNKFRIPISTSFITSTYGDELGKLLLADKIKFFMPAEDSAFGILGKIIPIGKYYFYDTILSLGDIIILISIVLIIQEIMTDKFIQTKNTITLSKSLYKRNLK